MCRREGVKEVGVPETGRRAYISACNAYSIIRRRQIRAARPVVCRVIERRWWRFGAFGQGLQQIVVLLEQQPDQPDNLVANPYHDFHLPRALFLAPVIRTFPLHQPLVNLCPDGLVLYGVQHNKIHRALQDAIPGTTKFYCIVGLAGLFALGGPSEVTTQLRRAGEIGDRANASDDVTRPDMREHRQGQEDFSLTRVFHDGDNGLLQCIDVRLSQSQRVDKLILLQYHLVSIFLHADAGARELLQAHKRSTSNLCTATTGEQIGERSIRDGFRGWVGFSYSERRFPVRIFDHLGELWEKAILQIGQPVLGSGKIAHQFIVALDQAAQLCCRWGWRQIGMDALLRLDGADMQPGLLVEKFRQVSGVTLVGFIHCSLLDVNAVDEDALRLQELDQSIAIMAGMFAECETGAGPVSVDFAQKLFEASRRIGDGLDARLQLDFFLPLFKQVGDAMGIFAQIDAQIEAIGSGMLRDGKSHSYILSAKNGGVCGERKGHDAQSHVQAKAQAKRLSGLMASVPVSTQGCVRLGTPNNRSGLVPPPTHRTIITYHRKDVEHQ